MFAFFVVLAVIGLIGSIVSIVMLIFDREPFVLWVILIYVCGAMFFVGAVAGGALEDSTNTIIQEEQIEDVHQYNYCPYCGKEIK